MDDLFNACRDGFVGADRDSDNGSDSDDDEVCIECMIAYDRRTCAC